MPYVLIFKYNLLFHPPLVCPPCEPIFVTGRTIKIPGIVQCTCASPSLSTRSLAPTQPSSTLSLGMDLLGTQDTCGHQTGIVFPANLTADGVASVRVHQSISSPTHPNTHPPKHPPTHTRARAQCNLARELISSTGRPCTICLFLAHRHATRMQIFAHVDHDNKGALTRLQLRSYRSRSNNSSHANPTCLFSQPTFLRNLS